MTAKEFLNQYLEASGDIDDKLSEIAQLRALSTKLGVALNPDKVQTSGSTDSLAVIMGKIVDMEREIDSDIDRLRLVKRTVVSAIMDIQNHKQRRVLYHRYILGEKWDEIADKMYIDLRWVHRLHGRALAKIEIDH